MEKKITKGKPGGETQGKSWINRRAYRQRLSEMGQGGIAPWDGWQACQSQSRKLDLLLHLLRSGSISITSLWTTRWRLCRSCCSINYTQTQALSCRRPCKKYLQIPHFVVCFIGYLNLIWSFLMGRRVILVVYLYHTHTQTNCCLSARQSCCLFSFHYCNPLQGFGLY